MYLLESDRDVPHGDVHIAAESRRQEVSLILLTEHISYRLCTPLGAAQMLHLGPLRRLGLGLH